MSDPTEQDYATVKTLWRVRSNTFDFRRRFAQALADERAAARTATVRENVEWMRSHEWDSLHVGFREQDRTADAIEQKFGDWKAVERG